MKQNFLKVNLIYWSKPGLTGNLGLWLPQVILLVGTSDNQVYNRDSSVHVNLIKQIAVFVYDMA